MLFGAGAAIAQPKAFGFDDVVAKARALAATAQKVPDAGLSKELLDLDYDQYRDIRFRPDRGYWRDAKLPFELQFFHPGFHYNRTVRMHEVAAGVVRDIPFSSTQFDYGKNNLDPTKLRAQGFAGFRVHFALNAPKYKDEVLVFLGASYFRALGKGQVYGLSARGLAVDTALGSGEEFPSFTEFWIERPTANATQLTIFALLDSRRVAGAYKFIVKPGADTMIEVSARVFLREQVAKLGIAPLTTMYLFGENQPNAGATDFRPEVHDSDGLSIQAGTGEWIWRPLVNPKRLLVSSFALSNPVGFGLQQRDRRFSHYEDLEAHYEKRPAVWVQPVGNWGAGRVELVQIPTPDETNDNIVAYWVPDSLPALQSQLAFEYKLLWQMDNAIRPPQSWVTQTRRGHGYRRQPDDSIDFVIDFEGPVFAKLPADTKVEPVVTGQNVETREAIAYPNTVTSGYRMALRLKRLDDAKPVELRAFLRAADGGTISETWSYLLPPN
ncbi:MAG TPA: glucan biosynthesis protein G [Casimicrobiaceae bacterium]|nr:glucan biosynthesis protein G [Casimicrobiaceae bacterium]